MNRMLAILPDDYKPDFILRGLFLQRLPIDVHSHLLPEKVTDPQALALKADKLYQSRISSSWVNLLSEIFDKSLQVNTVSSRARPPKTPLSRRSQTPAPTSRPSTPSGACWIHKKHGDKAVTCRKPSSPAGGTPHPTCWFSSSSFRSNERRVCFCSG